MGARDFNWSNVIEIKKMDITVLVSIGFHGRSSCDIISGEP
jgi:hypothetical protein